MFMLASTMPPDMFFGLTLKQLLAIIIPIVVIQWGIIIAALVNLRSQDPRGIRGGKVLWLIILLLCLIEVPLGLIGPILYFTIGRVPYAGD